MDWLKQALINSTATFQVIASGSPFFNDANSGEGHTELIKLERKKSYPLYELSCSP